MSPTPIRVFHNTTPPAAGHLKKRALDQAPGIDHEKLAFRHNRIDKLLTDVHGPVIRNLIA